MADDKFEEPVVLKEAERVISDNQVDVVTVRHLEYNVNGRKYPKLVLSTYKIDSNGFPQSRPKSVGLPIDMSKKIADAILSLAK